MKAFLAAANGNDALLLLANIGDVMLSSVCSEHLFSPSELYLTYGVYMSHSSCRA